MSAYSCFGQSLFDRSTSRFLCEKNNSYQTDSVTLVIQLTLSVAFASCQRSQILRKDDRYTRIDTMSAVPARSSHETSLVRPSDSYLVTYFHEPLFTFLPC
jgi:hypothetical protein